MDMELEPSLATEWEAVEDDVWEFKLREDVKFHDGSDFNADVVKTNIERVMDEEVGSPRAFLYEMISDIEVVDDHTVRFITEYPFAPLPAHLDILRSEEHTSELQSRFDLVCRLLL